MKFNVVIGNPPYNNDLYIDFVEVGHKMSKNYTVMITPAKWQAKGGEKNEKFRQNVVPYMNHIIFYPCAQEIFDIRNIDGIAYYMLENEETEDKIIDNRCGIAKIFNNRTVRKIEGQLNNCGYQVIKAVKKSSKEMLNNNYKFRNDGAVYNYDSPVYSYEGINCKYVLMMMGMNGNCYYDSTGKALGLNKTYVMEKDEIKNLSADYEIVYQDDSLEKVQSFDSYINTKLIRFIIMMSLVGQRCDNDESWRFVPDPGELDHIFTDEEVYQMFKLGQAEIDIVESVIKNRKNVSM